MRVGVVLGDVVHNLRSALDYLFWQLYCHHIRVPLTYREAKTVQFPIEDDGKRFANKRGNFSKIPWAQWAVIDIAQPYNGLDPPRAALRRRFGSFPTGTRSSPPNPLLLRTTMIQLYDHTLAGQATTDFEFPDDRKFALGGRYLMVGTEVMRVGLPGNVDAEMEVAGHVTPAIQLPEMDTALIFGVSVMIKAVDRIVKGIEPLL